MKKILLSLFALFLVSGIYAQLDDQPLLLHLDFEDEDDIALNEQDLTYDDEEPTAEYSTDAIMGTGAASFDGLQYIIFDVNEDIHCQTLSYSWAMWVKTDAIGGSMCAWAPYSGSPAAGNGDVDENDLHDAGVHALFWGFENESGVPVFDIGWIDLFPGDVNINDGAWHHVVLTNDVEGTSQIMYVDGVVQTNVGAMDPGDYPADEQSTDPATWVLKVGYATSAWPSDETEEVQFPYFTGVMDDFRMYGSALSADDVAELYALTSAEAFETELDFAVFPNPASEYIMIKTTQNRDLAIYNSVGQLILSETDVQNGSTIDISDLETGLYFVKSEESIQKLIIE